MDGVTFNTTHSSTYGIYLSSVEIEKPMPKTSYISIPYGDGDADLTEAYGEVKYNMRKIKMTFQYPSSTLLFETLMTTFANAWQGKKVKITFDKDPNYYYWGRLNIGYGKKDIIGEISVEAYCEPYKYKLAVTSQTEAVTTSKAVTITNDRMRAYPLITTDASFSIVKDGVTYSYGTVTDYQTTIPLNEGSNSLTVTGTGNITFEWQEGAL